jgi:molybdopterin converting factor small subunit
VIYVKVQSILHLAAALGGREFVVELGPDTTVGALLLLISERLDRDNKLLRGNPPQLRPGIVVSLNGRSLHRADGLDAALRDGDVLLIVPAIGGG